MRMKRTMKNEKFELGTGRAEKCEELFAMPIRRGTEEARIGCCARGGCVLSTGREGGSAGVGPILSLLCRVAQCPQCITLLQ